MIHRKCCKKFQIISFEVIELFILPDILKLIRNDLKKIFLLIVIILPKHSTRKMMTLYIFTFFLYRSFIIIRDKYFFCCVKKVRSFCCSIPIFLITIFINEAIF